MKTFLLTFIFVLTLYANERIISLSPSITEIIFALNKGDKMIATSSYSLYPDEAKKLQVIGGYRDPNLEKIISLSPTLVVGQLSNQATLDKLKTFNIKTLTLDLQTIESIKNSINLLAKKIDSKRNKKLVLDIDESLKSSSKNKKPHSVLIVYGLREDLRNAIYVAGHNIFFEDIILASGNTNAYTNSGIEQPVLSYENIIAINPDQIIILHSHATGSHIDVQKALRNWLALPTNASKNGKISIVDDDYIHIPSHRITNTINRLYKEMDSYND